MLNVAIKAGLMVAQIGLGMLRKIEGPRLESRKFSSGQYGITLARVWGTAWVAGQFIWGKDLIEVKRTRKTKGGKFNDYSYYGDFAVVLTCHQIAAVRRIKADGHLIFDLSGAGPVTPFEFTSAASGGGKAASGAGGAWLSSDYFAIWLGGVTQQVDEVIAAHIEALHGEGATPAYRGYGVIRFHNLPLEKFGNRIPQIEAEVQSLVNASWPYQEIDTSAGGDQLLFSPDFAVLYSGSYTEMAILDTAARAVINQFSGSFSGIGTRFAAMDDGDFIALAGGTDKPYRYDVYGGLTGPANPIVNIAMRNLTSAVDAAGNSHWITKARDTTQWYFDGVAQGTTLSGNHAFADLEGNIWVLGYPDSTSIEFRQLSGTPTGPSSITVTGLPVSGGGPDGAFHFRDATRDQFIFSRAGLTYAVARATGAILVTLSSSHGTPAYHNIRPGVATFWAGFREFQSADLTLVRLLTPATTWGLSISTTAQVIYDPLNHALVRFGATGPQWLYLDRLGAAGVTLGTIVSDVYAVGGGDVARIDVAAIPYPIAGYTVSGGSGKDWVEPLLDLYDVDPRPHGFALQFLPRGGAAGASISSDSFVLNGDGGDSPEPLFASVGEGSSDVPVQVVVQFADIAADGQPNSAASPRLSEPDGRRVQTIDMRTLALAAGEAKQLAARYHRRRIFDARSQSLAVTPQQIELEPGDVRPLSLRGVAVTARMTSMELGADQRIATEWRRDDLSVALLDGSTGAAFAGRTPSVIAVPLLTRGFVLDLPYLADNEAQTAPLLHLAAGPLAAGPWPGAVIYQAVDGEYSDEIASVPSGSAAAWGYVAAALPAANPNLWDRLSVMSVTLQLGALVGCTEAEIDANPLRNLALVQSGTSWELIQFTSATLTAPLTWSVSGLKRGRRGTEGACTGHAARDVFVLADNAVTASMGLSEVGTALSFKAITAGRTTGFPVHLTPYTGASLKPYAPCQLEAVQSGSDWVLGWVRRTRVGGAWTSGTTIPLSELSELYEVEVMDGATVKRSFTGLASPTVTYTAAQQTTDWGAALTSPPVFRVYQISAAVGRGFMALAA